METYGEEVVFTILPQHLELYNRQNKFVVEPGKFKILVGSSSTDIRATGEILVTKQAVK